MQTYIESFKAYLFNSKKSSRTPNAEAMLDALYLMYSEENLIENAKIRQCFQELELLFSQFTFWEADRLFSAVSLLCAAYEQAAFTEGVCAGARLMLAVADDRRFLSL